MTTATPLPPKRSRAAGWLTQLLTPKPVRTGRSTLPAVSISHPTQATLRWA